MMGKNRFRGLRVLVMVILVLLIVQFEFGMAVTIANPPEHSPFSFSIVKISDALNQAGVAALLHASLGTLLAVFFRVKPGPLASLQGQKRANHWVAGFPCNCPGSQPGVGFHPIRLSKR